MIKAGKTIHHSNRVQFTCRTGSGPSSLLLEIAQTQDYRSPTLPNQRPLSHRLPRTVSIGSHDPAIHRILGARNIARVWARQEHHDVLAKRTEYQHQSDGNSERNQRLTATSIGLAQRLRGAMLGTSSVNGPRCSAGIAASIGSKMFVWSEELGC